MANFEELRGKVLTEILVSHNNDGNDSITFVCDDGTKYKLYHEQDCCESVDIQEISGDINDLLKDPLILAEERTQEGENEYGTETYTFYTLSTIKGYVDIRWYGESNGYYSESVDFIKI